jgi:AcrR family transcriptional regulator
MATKAGAARARSDAFPVSPTLRSPAPQLGPRANRTIGRILEATRAIFTTRGYAGTTIDEIARLAGISRASFYTYFPTKRDVLLALGADSARLADDIVAQLDAEPRPISPVRIDQFVDDYWEMMEQHGAFASAWTQAAHEDDEIRTAGMKRHLDMCRHLGTIVAPGPGETSKVLKARGVVIYSMFERGWSYCQLYTGVLAAADVKEEIARTLNLMVEAEASART